MALLAHWPIGPPCHIPDPSRPRSFRYVRPRGLPTVTVLRTVRCSGSPFCARPTGWDGDVRGCWDGNSPNRSQSNTISDKTDTFLCAPPPHSFPPWSRSQATIGAQGPEMCGDPAMPRIRKRKRPPFQKKKRDLEFPTPSRAPRSTPPRFPTPLASALPNDPGEKKKKQKTSTSVLRAHERSGRSYSLISARCCVARLSPEPV
jgi:hypothetical protein